MILPLLAILPALMVSCHKKEAATAPRPYRVEVIAVDSTDIAASRVYSGTIEESSASTLSFPVAGTLQSINVAQGDRVAKGALIASLDAATLKNAHEISLAALNEAQDTYDRMKKLHDSNSLSDMQWVEVENALLSAKSAEAISRRSLGDAMLYAPFSGYVAEKYVESGTNMAPGIPVVKLVVINPVKVNISIPENEISGISIGQEATVSGTSLPRDSYQGRVSERAVSANPITRSYDVKIELANADAALLPGMICDVQLATKGSQNAIVLPNAAVLINGNNKNYVWLARQGRSYRQEVVVDGMADNGLVIGSGLAAGDTVIVKGQQKVSEGSEIEIIK